jgi:hypothetical protein
MSCNNISSCSGIGSTVIGGNKNSVQYGYTDKSIQLSGASGTFTIWEAVGLSGLSGTVCINPKRLPATTSIIINGINTTALTNDIYCRSVDPLDSVQIYATTSDRTSVNASIIATGFSIS